MMLTRNLTLSLFTLLALTACGPAENGPPDVPASADAQKSALAKDPGPALSVVKAKAAGPAKEVTLEGRIYDITKGYTVFRIMDIAMDYCGQINKEDGCKTPWDFCCDTKDDIAANSLLVEMRGADGKPLKSPSLPGCRLLDHVKLTGELIKDEHGNLVLLASGIFRAERPQAQDYVVWPE